MMKNGISKCPNLSAILFTLLFIFSFSSCERMPETTVEIIIKDGLIFKEGESKPYTGIVKDTVEGKVIEYYAIDGKKTGEFKTYFKNGKLEMIGQIKENLNQGKWIYYYQSGTIESEGIFKDDIPDSTWKWFYENGNLKEEGSYIKGIRDGRWVMFDADGKITEEKIFPKNQVQETK